MWQTTSTLSLMRAASFLAATVAVMATMHYANKPFASQDATQLGKSVSQSPPHPNPKPLPHCARFSACLVSQVLDRTLGSGLGFTHPSPHPLVIYQQQGKSIHLKACLSAGGIASLQQASMWKSTLAQVLNAIPCKQPVTLSYTTECDKYEKQKNLNYINATRQGCAALGFGSRRAIDVQSNSMAQSHCPRFSACLVSNVLLQQYPYQQPLVKYQEKSKTITMKACQPPPQQNSMGQYLRGGLAELQYLQYLERISWEVTIKQLVAYAMPCKKRITLNFPFVIECNKDQQNYAYATQKDCAALGFDSRSPPTITT